jgi:carnitine monooxygenase subunit
MSKPLPPDLAQGETQHDPEEFQSLPGWLYHDPEFFAYEAVRVFRASWQVVCHVNDIPNAGDYVTFDYLGESIVALRGDDGAVRAFHNVCRHRAARLLDGPAGHCRFRLSCPYHGWSYDLRGRLAGVPFRETFLGLDMAAHGLKPVEHEIYHGFIFIRLGGSGPSVAEMMSPCEAEIAAYRMEEMVPLGRVTLRSRAVNWKTISDNYSDSLHINVAHPGLTRLFGKGYGKFWPNIAFDIYPDQIDFMQFVPVSATSTMIREIAYVHPDARREMKAARYLNWRINRQVNKEDTDLINRVQAGMASSSYEAGPLGTTEVCLRQFARKLRALAPMARMRRPPAS